MTKGYNRVLFKRLKGSAIGLATLSMCNLSEPHYREPQLTITNIQQIFEKNKIIFEIQIKKVLGFTHYKVGLPYARYGFPNETKNLLHKYATIL